MLSGANCGNSDFASIFELPSLFSQLRNFVNMIPDLLPTELACRRSARLERRAS